MAVLAEPNTSSEIVLEAQKLINKSALQSRAPEDGAFDKSTLAAIKQFQIESGLRPTGVLDDALMKVLKSAANKPNPTKQVKINGKIYLFTDAEHKALIKRISSDFKPAVDVLRSAVVEARGIWDNQSKLNNDQYIVAWCIEVYAGANLPPESLIKAAEAGVKACEKALGAGDLAAFSAAFPKAQTQANDARMKMKTYLSKVIDGGEGMVTGLTIISTASFIVVGLIAAPVAASYGAGAMGAAVIAGSGTAAIESISHEVGKGISGSSKGIGDAAFNVLKDSFIGGSIGAIVKGKAGEKIIAKIGPTIASKLGGTLFKSAGPKAVEAFVKNYFQKNGAAILEGIMTDVMKEYKSSADGLTFEKFCGIVAKQVVTAGVFAKFDAAADIKGKAVWAAFSDSQKKELLKGFGDKGKMSDVEDVFGKIFGEISKELAGRVYDKVLSTATGSETAAKLKTQITDAFASDKKLMEATKAAVEKEAKKKKK